jgi:hypothetical protein
MAKLNSFKASVPLHGGICGSGKRDYPLVQAHDVQVDEDGTRLDEKLEMLRSGGATIYEGTVTANDTGNGNILGNLGKALSLTQGAAYKVTFNGTEYKCVGSKQDIYPYLGNARFLDENREDTGEPFCLTFATNTTYLETAVAGEYTLTIYEVTSGSSIAITEVSSPEEITADSPDGFYVVPGGESGGGSTGGTPLHYYDSLDAVPADLPEGSFVAVPSSGESGGNAKVIDLSDDNHKSLGPYVFGLLLSGEDGADYLIDESNSSIGVGISTVLAECDTNQLVSFKLSYSDISVITNPIIKAYQSDAISEVAFSLTLVYGPYIYKSNVCFLKGGLLAISFTKTALSM